MIETIDINNFRIFNSLSFQPTDINIISGKNNVGKTSVLEAVFLLIAANNPERTRMIHSKRAGGPFVAHPDRVWRWLFHEGDPDNEVRITASEEDGKRILRMRMEKSKRVEVSGDVNESGNPDSYNEVYESTTTDSDKDLVFEYDDTFGRSFEARGWLDSEGDLNFESKEDVYGRSIYIPANEGFTLFDIQRLSDIKERKEEDQIISALRNIDERIQDISISAFKGAPSVVGDVRGEDRLIPLSVLGQGISRVLKFSVGIHNCKNGIVFIDEFENGIHHSVMRDIWHAVFDIASNSDVQVFSTTHSYECIDAFQEVARESKKSGSLFSLRRNERKRDDISAIEYSEEEIKSATRSNLEVR